MQKISKATYTVFDFETTGLFPYAGDKICEIGAVRFTPGRKTVKQFHTMVNPRRPISHQAFLVNGITCQMLKDAPPVEKVLDGFLGFMRDSILVAYNAGFDLGFLEAALGDRKELIEEYNIVDALGLSRRLFKKIPSYSLANITSSLGIKMKRGHRALADAMATLEVFRREIEVLAEQGCDNVEEIAFLNARPCRTAAKVKDYRLAIIEDAIRQERCLTIKYRSSWNGRTTARRISPKSVRHAFDRSYVIAHCHLRNEERNFRLDGIVDIAKE